MAAIEDRTYLKLCAELASCLGISLASARRKVELACMKEGIKELAARKCIAEELLKKARLRPLTGEGAPSTQFDQLLEARADEENFMVED